MAGLPVATLVPGQCIILTSGTALTVGPSRLWLSNLYLRYISGGRNRTSEVERNGTGMKTDSGEAAGDFPVLLRQLGGDMWMTQVVLQGDGTSMVQGMDMKNVEGSVGAGKNLLRDPLVHTYIGGTAPAAHVEYRPRR